MISFLSPAVGLVEDGTGFRILSIFTPLTTLSMNSIPIPRIVTFGIFFLSVTFYGSQLMKISANVDSPIKEISVLKILTVSGFPIKALKSSPF